MNVIIKPCKESIGTGFRWEVRDKKDRLIGIFDAVDKTTTRYDKLVEIAKITNLMDDLFDVKQRIKDLIHKDNAWEVNDAASQARTQTENAIEELNLMRDHLDSEI